jgi:hypothetical protein
MKLLKSNFNKIKRVLSHIEISKGIVNFFPDGVDELPSEDPESMMIQDESIIFIDGDGNTISIESLIKHVNNEVQENHMLNIDINDKLQYLKEVIDFYSSIEDDIDENGIINSQPGLIIFKDLSINDLHERERGMLNSFLSRLKKSLRAELIELENNYNRYYIKPTHENNRIIKDFKFKSFIINNKSILISNDFEMMFEELKHDYITCDDIRNFRKIFKGESIVEKVIWKGKHGALKYYIKVLVEKGIIKCPQPIYLTTAYCFKYPNKEVIHDKLSHDHLPSKKIQDDIDEIISSLTT